MKTVKEWLLWADAQGYEWAHKAMHNHIVSPMSEYNEIGFSRLDLALEHAFLWTKSPEGRNYWLQIFEDLKPKPS